MRFFIAFSPRVSDGDGGRCSCRLRLSRFAGPNPVRKSVKVSDIAAPARGLTGNLRSQIGGRTACGGTGYWDALRSR